MVEREPTVSDAVSLREADLPPVVQRALELCQERNARELRVLDLRGLSDATDFFIIASGDSEVHVRAIYQHVVEGLSHQGIRSAGVEGARAGRWVLVDYFDLVLHVFHPLVREFYQLELLWGDAPVMVVEESEP